MAAWLQICSAEYAGDAKVFYIVIPDCVQNDTTESSFYQKRYA